VIDPSDPSQSPQLHQQTGNSRVPLCTFMHGHKSKQDPQMPHTHHFCCQFLPCFLNNRPFLSAAPEPGTCCLARVDMLRFSLFLASWPRPGLTSANSTTSSPISPRKTLASGADAMQREVEEVPDTESPRACDLGLPAWRLDA
jgi:hypothetical protein